MDKIYARFLGDVDLKALQAKWTGGEFRAFVAHLMELGPGLFDAFQADNAAFDSKEAEVAADVTREFQDLAKDQSFWSRDAGQVLGQITTRFEDKMNERGWSTDDITKFNMFQSVAHGFALTAVVNPDFRKFIGL